jgi:hypothetical protein
MFDMFEEFDLSERNEEFVGKTRVPVHRLPEADVTDLK